MELEENVKDVLALLIGLENLRVRQKKFAKEFGDDASRALNLAVQSKLLVSSYDGKDPEFSFMLNDYVTNSVWLVLQRFDKPLKTRILEEAGVIIDEIVRAHAKAKAKDPEPFSVGARVH